MHAHGGTLCLDMTLYAYRTHVVRVWSRRNSRSHFVRRCWLLIAAEKLLSWPCRAFEEVNEMFHWCLAASQGEGAKLAEFDALRHICICSGYGFLDHSHGLCGKMLASF